MKLKLFLIVIIMLSFFRTSEGKINAKLMRYMDVSDTQITFVYGGDIWLMPKDGGTAIQVTHSSGEESWPKFSPDGKYIGYTAAYNGNSDIYVIPVSGGLPVRVTYNSFPDRMIDWHPDGKRILFRSSKEMGIRRLGHFYLVDKNSGFPKRLKIPYGELATFSPDGKRLAYITKITENYPFKRYRGGLTSDILIFNINDNKIENITKTEWTEGKPAWTGNFIYFLSDRGANMRHNIWKYNVMNREIKQVTAFKDFDITYMSAGNRDIVFEEGGRLYLLNLSNDKYKEVEVNVISDLSNEMPRKKSVGRRIENMTLSPNGKRVIFEARGELFNVPAEKGFVKNLTKTSGAWEHNPSWSPDGKNIAYWSDVSGEYEIYLKNLEGNVKKLTKRGKGFGYKLFWSPDSKNIAFIDETNTIFIVNSSTGILTKVANTKWNIGHGERYSYSVSWSPDSKWLTFALGMNNSNNAIYVYDITGKKLSRVTNGFFNDMDPVFSKDGKYLFFITSRSMNPIYSDMGDGTWIYPNSGEIAVISLTSGIKSFLYTENDSFKPEENKKISGKKKSKKTDAKKPDINVKIDFKDIESRMEILPPKAGNIGALYSLKGKLIYIRWPNSGSGEKNPSLMFYDIKERKEKKIIDGVNNYVITADGKSILVKTKRSYGVVKPVPAQKIKKPIPVNGLVMNWVPKEEWHQIFNDVWRRFRDFFYDPGMQGVDWKLMKERYGALIDYARTRQDINVICSNMQAELSAGHTYTFGGDSERVKPVITGFLGIDWGMKNGKFIIKRVVKPAQWDTVKRSPFDKTGVDVMEGDYILSVNGVTLDPKKDPYCAFEGLSGKTVELKISKSGLLIDSKDVVVKCLTQREESILRFYEWVEGNRKMVDKLSDGKLGYVYMADTSATGQKDLVRMYYAQVDKKGFIIDERFNGGGQLADRFLEILKRPVIYNLNWRHGKDQTVPSKVNTGPVGMLINGWAGSGGDGLPWAFRELKAGPIIGERTLGILVGPATGHMLIDGGGITVPGARLYYNNGKWFQEGVGVRPDLKVWDDPNILMKGRDLQIEKLVNKLVEQLKTNKPEMTPAPKKEDRTAKGLKKIYK